MTPEEFRMKAEQIVIDCAGDAGANGGVGHQAMDCLMEDCIRQFDEGYEKGLELLDRLRHVCYGKRELY